MLVVKKETIASLALLALAGVFLYLGFTQGGSPWSEMAPVPVVKSEEAGTPPAGAPTSGGTKEHSTGTGAPPMVGAPGASSEQRSTASPKSAAPPTLPQPAQDPLEGPQGKELKEKSGEEFFIEYRLERDRVRSQEIQMLREVINNPNSSAQVRNEAQQRLIRLTEYMEQEMQLEALLQAKGYTDACVFIQPTAVHVIVRAHELKEEELNRIGELVGRTSGRKMEEVVIIPWP